jgi:uncharacterized protein YbcI
MTEIEAVRSEIAEEIERVQVEAYGGGLRKVAVQFIDDLVVVIMDVEFSRAEQTLVDAGHPESVRQTREAFQEAITPTFKAIVERATGRTVESFASRMIMEPPWSAEVFRLAPPAGGP